MPLPDSLLRSLGEAVGAEGLLTDPADVIPFGFDGTAALRQRPAGVVFPRSTAQVVSCVRAAADHGVPIVTRGSGTGLSGGSVPSSDSLVVCLAQMNAILEVDARNLTIRAQAGVVTQKIDEGPCSMACSIRLIQARCESARSAATSRRTRAAFAA